MKKCGTCRFLRSYTGYIDDPVYPGKKLKVTRHRCTLTGVRKTVAHIACIFHETEGVRTNAQEPR